jgi:hypothetical protein
MFRHQSGSNAMLLLDSSPQNMKRFAALKGVKAVLVQAWQQAKIGHDQCGALPSRIFCARIGRL